MYTCGGVMATYFWHDRNALGVDGAQVGIFKQADQVRFRRFLKRHHGSGFEANIDLEILRDFADEALEG